MEKVLDVFAERLTDIMREKKLNQKELSIKLKIPYSTLNSWLLKKRCPSIEYLKILCDFLCVSADYLIGRED